MRANASASGGVFRIACMSLDDLSCLDLRHAVEKAARCVVELNRELVRGEAREARGQAIDRVVLDRPRRVAAGVGDFEPIVLIHLLAGLHAVVDPLAFAVQPSAGAFVDARVRRRSDRDGFRRGIARRRSRSAFLRRTSARS